MGIRLGYTGEKYSVVLLETDSCAVAELINSIAVPPKKPQPTIWKFHFNSVYDSFLLGNLVNSSSEKRNTLLRDLVA